MIITPEEKKLEEAAKIQFPETDIEEYYLMAETAFLQPAFIIGAKSDAAKAYWQKGMYTEEEVFKLVTYAAERAQDNHMQFPYQWISDWFEQNKKKEE